MSVFVLDKNRVPLDPCSSARARKLLDSGKASVLRRFPFAIILKDRGAMESVIHEHRVKIDPGSKVTGMAVIQEETAKVVFAAEIEHRGRRIRAALKSRSAIRRGRRSRKTRYRQPRFDNRTRPKGWLPPSLESRISNVLTWVARLSHLCPVTAISQELVRFDMQAMENPEISGIEYQQGNLLGYEVREYLLEKWCRKCAYCDKEGVPLQIDHIQSRSRGGSDRVANLTLACEACNQRKGNQPVEDFLAKLPDRLAKIKRQAKASLKDAAAVNATRWSLFHRLSATGLPVECGTGGRTKFNRVSRGLPKAHWIDAACVGVSTLETLRLDGIRPLQIKACGYGSRQMCATNKFGFPKQHKLRVKRHLGFQTGDIVKAIVPSGKYQGTHSGRVVIRFKGCFQIGRIPVHPRYVTLVHQHDGYSYVECDQTYCDGTCEAAATLEATS